MEQQEQRLAQRKEEHQTAVRRAEELQEEEQRLHHRVKVSRGKTDETVQLRLIQFNQKLLRQ